jgi:hypothetical protein
MYVWKKIFPRPSLNMGNEILTAIFIVVPSVIAYSGAR